MKYIKKGNEPIEWTQHCATPGAGLEMQSQTRDALKKALLNDQGYICCYCGKRIFLDNNSIIEHLYPKGVKNYSHLELKYSNLLCSCDGGQSERAKNKKFPIFCDANKNNRVLLLTPLDEVCESQFSYDEDGIIIGITPAAQHAISVLNLNNPVINNRRKAAIEVFKDLEQSDTAWQDDINMLQSRDSTGQYLEYCFVVLDYLRSFKLAY